MSSAPGTCSTRLPDRAAAATVREQLLDVIETEGPIELAGSARIVARRFGLNAVRAARADDIAKLVPRSQVRKSRKLGALRVAGQLDPDTWTGFRFADARTPHVPSTRSRREEIANAMLAVLDEYPGP